MSTQTAPLFPRSPIGNLQSSTLACRRITAAANSSFPVAFRLLSPPKRRAMDALYAFMRLTDDIADEQGEVAAKRRNLALWRAGLLASLEGKFTHPIFPALADTVRRFSVPPQHLLEVIEGVESDLEPTRFRTFDDLYPYCYRVASAVGLACLPVWGFRSGVTAADAVEAAEAAGIAFQLTNILRDVGEDLGRGRVYLPADELERFAQRGCKADEARREPTERFGSTPESWANPGARPAFRAMMLFQAERARDFYRRAEPLAGMLSPEGRGIFRVMCGTYRALLDEIERSGFDVLARRVRVPKWRKGLILLDGWAARWGLR